VLADGRVSPRSLRQTGHAPDVNEGVLQTGVEHCLRRIWPALSRSNVCPVDEMDETMGRIEWNGVRCRCGSGDRGRDETIEVKTEVFRALMSNLGRRDFAMNTSSIFRRAGRLDGPTREVHRCTFNPVPVLNLVEVIQARNQPDETYETIIIRHVGRAPGKKRPWRCKIICPRPTAFCDQRGCSTA